MVRTRAWVVVALALVGATVAEGASRAAGPGAITTVAGSVLRGFAGDGGPATAARLSLPEGLAADGKGNGYIFDCANARVRVLRPDATIATIAGTGQFGFSGDGGPATSDQLRPQSRAVAEPVAGITDSYAFPSPDRPGHLVLVLNTLPFAAPTARFSDALLYRFRIRERPATARTPGARYLDGKNVLGLVVELDCASVLGDRDLVGVAAETLTRGKLNVRLESAGRPEVPNMMLGPTQFDRVNRDLELRDLYNMDDVFHPAHVYEGAYRARLKRQPRLWDGLDGEVDWPLDDGGAHPLTELVLADFLVVDVTKPYAEQGS